MSNHAHLPNARRRLLVLSPLIMALQGTAALASDERLPVLSKQFPSGENTGYQNAPDYPGSLTAADGEIRTNDKVYRFAQFQGATISGSNNTFVGCRFSSNWKDGWNVLVNGAGNTFSFCTVAPPEGVIIPNAAWPSAGAGVKGVDGFNNAARYQIGGSQGYQYGFRILSGPGTLIDRCDIWGFGNAVDLVGGSGVTVANSWIHDAAFEKPQGYHTDGVGYLDGGNGPADVVVRHCTIASLGNTNAIAFQASTGYRNVTVQECLLSGFGFTVDMGHNAIGNRGLRFIDNLLSTIVRPGFGLLYADFSAQFSPSPANNVWRGNRTDDGRFIHPNGVLSAKDWGAS
jgi:hypothetical protein